MKIQARALVTRNTHIFFRFFNVFNCERRAARKTRVCMVYQNGGNLFDKSVYEQVLMADLWKKFRKIPSLSSAQGCGLILTSTWRRFEEEILKFSTKNCQFDALRSYIYNSLCHIHIHFHCTFFKFFTFLKNFLHISQLNPLFDKKTPQNLAQKCRKAKIKLQFRWVVCTLNLNLKLWKYK